MKEEVKKEKEKKGRTLRAGRERRGVALST